MTTRLHRRRAIATLLRLQACVWAAVVCGGTVALAAKAPLSPATLQDQSQVIVSGKVVAVTSKTEKSEVETGAGVFRDRVYTIKVRVDSVAKGGGAGIETGGEIVVVAWQPSTRIPMRPGLQGHVPVPKVGDEATFYLTRKNKDSGGKGDGDGDSGGDGDETGEAGRLEPLLPNGIVIEAQKPGD